MTTVQSSQSYRDGNLSLLLTLVLYKSHNLPGQLQLFNAFVSCFFLPRTNSTLNFGSESKPLLLGISPVLLSIDRCLNVDVQLL